MRIRDELILFCVIGLTSLSIPIYACGPYYPDSVLRYKNSRPTGVPTTRFRLELERLLPEKKAKFSASYPSSDRYGGWWEKKLRQHTIDKGAGDLTLALGKADGAKETLKQYVLLRKEMRDSSDLFLRLKKGAEIKQKIPAKLPAEFRLYLTGALHYIRGDRQEAIAAWKRVLALPEGKRQYRSTWAAFMIGKAMMKDKPKAAIPWFQKVRALADKGFRDSMDLAAASYGWEAQVHYTGEAYTKALALYMTQFHAGDDTAIASIQNTIYNIIKEKKLKVAAGDPLSQKLVTVYFIAKGGPFNESPNAEELESWLTIIETKKLKDLVGIDRLALLAYQAGDMTMSRRFLKLAPEKNQMAWWLRAKFLIRDGKVKAAAGELAKLIALLPPTRKHNHYSRDEADSAPSHDQVRADLGVLQMTRREYTEAMHILILGGYWEDAAYVGENVLTIAELMEYVKLRWPNKPMSPMRTRMRKNVHNLLARRLTRLGRWKEARPYFSPDLRKIQTTYIDAIRKGHDKKLSKGVRAEAFWAAAMTAWEHGTEILDAEVSPPWRNRKDANPLGYTAQNRIDPKGESNATKDEQKRLTERLKDPANHTIHRYIAAEHAWSALELLPDQSDDTAERFVIAGNWLKHHDAKAADKFYKALVRRCGKTKLGQEADKLRWFPELEEEE